MEGDKDLEHRDRHMNTLTYEHKKYVRRVSYHVLRICPFL